MYTLGFRKNDKPRGPNKRTLKRAVNFRKFFETKNKLGRETLVRVLMNNLITAQIN